MENPIKMDDLGVPPFLETPTWTYHCFCHAAITIITAAVSWNFLVRLSWRGCAFATFERTGQGGPKLVVPQTGWWLNQPLWKICSSKWVHLPQVGGENKKWNHQLAKIDQNRPKVLELNKPWTNLFFHSETMKITLRVFLGGFFSAIFLDRRNASCFFFWKGWNFNESSTSEVWDWSIITSRGDEQSFGRQTLPETNSSHLKIHPWKFGDSYWKPSFLGSMWVSGRVFTRHLRWVLIWCDTLPETKT